MLNVEEDTAIENVLITRQIESAQKKVETYHFDIRKSVLEYDDVMNIQREKFYYQRRKVLVSKNLQSDIKFMISKETERILSQYINKDMSPQEYVWDDIVMLIKEFVSIFPQTKDKIKPEDIKDLRASEILDKLKVLSDEAYKEFEIETVNNFNEVMSKYYGDNYVMQEPFKDDNIVRNVEKDILLQVVDAKWIDHLGNIDMLKDSIGLVAYGQKDPLIEYKKEAYNYFNALMGEIQSETVQHLFRAKFGIQVVEE